MLVSELEKTGTYRVMTNGHKRSSKVPKPKAMNIYINWTSPFSFVVQ